MKKLPFFRVDGNIIAVYVKGSRVATPPVRARAADITYDAEFIRKDQFVTKLGFTPYNRRFHNSSIISANEGDYCDVQVNWKTNEANVYVHTERDDLRDCDGNPVEDL